MLSDNAREAFTSLFGSPATLQVTIAVLLVFLLVVAAIITIRNGIEESQEYESFDQHDLVKLVLRVIVVMLVMAIFFGF